MTLEPGRPIRKLDVLVECEPLWLVGYEELVDYDFLFCDGSGNHASELSIASVQTTIVTYEFGISPSQWYNFYGERMSRHFCDII